MNKAAIALVLLLFTAPAAWAATFTVTKTADTADGACNADCSLREAIIAANALPDADTIQLPPGIYTLTRAGDGEDSALTGDLDITENVTISGTGSATTAVDGGALDRVFEIYSPTATISGLTVRNGSFSGEGGGIRVHGSNSLVMQNAAVVNNAAPNKAGGGIKVTSGSLTLTNVTISGNSAKDSPGIFSQSGSLTLTNVTIANNSGTGKGAFNPGSGSLTIVNVIVANSVGVPDCDTDSGPAPTSLDSDGSCGFGITANPLLGPLQDNGGPTLTHELLIGSPAMDRGTSAGAPPTDQRGVARGIDGDGTPNSPAAGDYDIGAYEYDSTSADLRVTKSVDDSTPTEGDTVVYTVTLHNDGPDATTNVAVTDLLPAGVTYVSNVPTKGGYVSGTGVWTVGGMAGGASETLTLTATVDAGTAPSTIVNTAAVSAGDADDPTPGNDSDTADITVQTANLTLVKFDGPDPAPTHGPLVYTLLVTNNGPHAATNVTLTDTLPAGVTLVSATPSQGGCSGTTTVTCNVGAILSTGTASVEILVVTSTAGTITNNATVAADQVDLIPADNAAAENTDVVVSDTADIPLTQYRRIHGFVDSTVTGGSLRTQPNAVDPCVVGPSSSGNLSGIPATATVVGAYLYWAGSGTTVDNLVTFDGSALTADRTFQAQFSLGGTTYDFFGGFENVTAQVEAKRNGSYSFADLAVATANPYCKAKAVVAGWSLLVIYEDNASSGKTLVLYDGFDLERNGSTSYLLTSIFAADPPEAKTVFLLWEGDPDLGGGNERLEFNDVAQSDGLNPVDNGYNSTINSLGLSTSYGVDLDSFDVTSEMTAGDTLATTEVSTGPDLVILNAVMLQVKSNIITGQVFEDVNYGGGSGRDSATAAAAAPSFSVARPGATIELYDALGNFIRTTVTDADGRYGFAGLIDGDYTVRVVNDTVTSCRPSATGSEWPVQTFRTDASTGAAIPITNEVGGTDPQAQDDPANGGSFNLSSLTAQSLSPARILTGLTVSGVDFGFNFDTVVNTGDAGQGSLRQFILNSNSLGNSSLDQSGLTTGVETSLFMIPSAADPFGRPVDPGYDAGTGVFTIAPATNLPAITDADTALDGTTQTSLVGNTNLAVLGAGGTVGVDALALGQVAGPEIELRDTGSLTYGVRVVADDVAIRGLAILGFGTGSTGESAIHLANGLTGTMLEHNVLGSSAATFADPGSALRNWETIYSDGADSGTIRNNLIGFGGIRGIFLRNGSTGWTVNNNEIRNNGLDDAAGDGLALDSGGGTFTGNLIVGSSSQGIVVANSGGNQFTNNTVTGNGVGLTSASGAAAGITLRSTSGATVVDRNVLSANYAAGINVNDGAAGIVITRNSINANGTIAARNGDPATGQIGIDLNAPTDDNDLGTPPFFTLNDPADTVPGGNDLLNFPVLERATIAAGTLTLTGWARAGSVIELFIAEADPTGFGEGRTWTISLTEGGTAAGGEDPYADLDADSSGYGPGGVNGVAQGDDTTNRFRFDFPLPVGVGAGTPLTATARDGAGNTSEFGGLVSALPPLSIVKRAFQSDGTPIASGSTLPAGMPVKFMLYVNNPGGPVDDISLQDPLDPLFGYLAGSIRFDPSLASCAAVTCTPAEEAAIFSATDAVAAGTDAVDADVVSFDGATVHAGNGSVANAQLDLAGNKLWAMLFTVTMQ